MMKILITLMLLGSLIACSGPRYSEDFAHNAFIAACVKDTIAVQLTRSGDVIMFTATCKEFK